jgi:nucleoside-diphosphate-sugar epimerase
MGPKKILVTGCDGMIGWSLVKYLLEQGHSVWGIDNMNRRKWVKEIGSDSITPIPHYLERPDILRQKGFNTKFIVGDLQDYNLVYKTIEEIRPDTIVHLGEQPSAPFSMIDVDHAVTTQINNIRGTLNLLFAIRDINPNIHLVKLGTMGQYQIGNLPISEDWIEVEYKGRKETIPFPKVPGSLYHCSKAQDTLNIEFACRVWNLNITDVNQGVVFGLSLPTRMNGDNLFTRYDVDSVFGTVINRYCAQAVVNHPLTIYGIGGQVRGFLALRDSIKCLTLLIESPAKRYRIVNQFSQEYDVSNLASKVATIGKDRFGWNNEIIRYENPRVEKEDHFYQVERKKLAALGYRPSLKLEEEIELTLCTLLSYREKIEELKDHLLPNVQWTGEKKQTKEMPSIEEAIG